MNTPAHILIGAAAFGRSDDRQKLYAAALGSLLPDVSLYLMAGVAILLLNIEPQVVFDELYYSSTWQLVFSIDNSFIVWSSLLLLGVLIKNKFLTILCSAALLHVVSDFLLHNDDARAHLWPLTQWRFLSPLSYWDSNHHARFVGPILALASCIATWVICKQRWHFSIKAAAIILFACELFVLLNWILFF